MNKNILITGGSQGIGKNIADTLSVNSDYNVYATARNEEALKKLKIKNYCVCDLKNLEQLKTLAEFIQDNKINILVNNAGEYIYSGIEKMTYEQIDEIFKINSIAPSYLISKVVPYMKEIKWGRIVNIGSISGNMGEAYASMYSATKASLAGLTKALALELAEYNITINTINPGWVDTSLGEKSINDSEFSKDEIIDMIPQKRFVAPLEISNMIKYIISDEAKGLTGQVINLCAGLSVGI